MKDQGGGHQGSPAPRGMSVVFVYADTPMEWNCSEWRSKAPADAFNLPENRANGWKAKLIHSSGFLDYLDPAIQDWVGPCDIIIFQRNVVNARALDAIRYWQGMGKPVAIDLDDAYQILPRSNPAHAFWIDRISTENPDPLGALEKGLQQSDGLLSPNRNILSDWSHLVDGYYLPNFARRAWWSGLPSREELKTERGLQDRIVIGWGGSVSHYDSWWGSGLREAARMLCRRHPEVTWLVCGNDDRIYHQLPVPSDQKVIQEGVMPDVWPRTVSCFDIGVAPLYGIYDQRRSWIKGLEYMLGKVPWIATGGETYRDLARFGRLLPNSVEGWLDALEFAVANLAAEQAVAERNRKVAEQWFVENQLGVFHNVYSRIRARFTGGGVIGLPGLHHVRAGDTGRTATGQL